MAQFRSENRAVRIWPRLGFVNRPGDAVDADLSVHRHFKGRLHRAIFEKIL